MSYFAELRANWRPLLAATIGMGSGMSIVGVVTSTRQLTVKSIPAIELPLDWSAQKRLLLG